MQTELGRERIRFTVTTYDFLAYFVPGFIFILCVYFIENLLYTNIQNLNQEIINNLVLFKFYQFFKPLINLLKEGNNWLFSLLMALLLIIISYVAGHVVASFSAFFLDRNLIGRYFNYPYKTLLKYPERQIKNNYGKRLIAIIFLLNSILPIILLFSNKLQFHCVLILLFLLIIVGLFCFEFVNKIIRLIINLIKNLIYVGDPFDEYFINKFRDNFNKVFDYHYEEAHTNIYWFTRNLIIEKANELNDMLKNWFNLYSFSRNLCTSFYLAYLVLSIEIIYLEKFVNLPNAYLNLRWNIIFFVFLLLVISLILLLRYGYLYYAYYNKYLYRTFVYLTSKKTIVNQ